MIRPVKELEVYSIFFSLDKLFLTDTLANFSDKIKFYFTNCLTTERSSQLRN